MIRNYYKKYLWIGILFLIIMLGIAAVNPPIKYEQYYWNLFNRFYVSILYLPLFLFGQFCVLSDLFVPECAMRYETKWRLQMMYLGRIFAYAVYYAALFIASNLIAEQIFGNYIYQVEENTLLFYLAALLLQSGGWFLVGTIFFFLYSLLKHFVVTWGAVMVIINILGMIGERGDMEFFRYFFSPYHIMYQFVFMKNVPGLIAGFLCEIAESILIIGCIYQIFIHMDFIERQKEG